MAATSHTTSRNRFPFPQQSVQIVRKYADTKGSFNIQNTVIYTHLVSSSRTEKARKHFSKLPHF